MDIQILTVVETETELAYKSPSRHSVNGFNTSHLVLNVMSTCARRLGLDIDDDAVAEELYWVCCSLESFPEDCGFGSSDSYSYVEEARRVFHMPEPMPETF